MIFPHRTLATVNPTDTHACNLSANSLFIENKGVSTTRSSQDVQAIALFLQGSSKPGHLAIGSSGH